MRAKTVLIVNDNLPEQINGVVTTYKNIEAHAVLDGYSFVYLDPRRFRYVDCPVYNELKIALPWKIGKAIEEISADYIHIATEGSLGLCARQYLNKRGYRYNTAYHTKFPEGLRKLFGIPEIVTWPLIRWFHTHAGSVLTTTDSMVTQLRQQGFRNPLIAWTRGVDRAVFHPGYDSPHDHPYLLCVSRVSKEKNLPAFFEMPYAGYQKVMVGDGPMLDVYRKRYPDVFFVGYRRGANLAPWFSHAAAFVFPSQWETFGLVMIEAMACGAPVAAFPVAGPLDVIEPEVSGALDWDLAAAVDRALKLDRKQVLQSSYRWDWHRAWTVFRDNLVPARLSNMAC